jgi:hypothetical protein
VIIKENTWFDQQGDGELPLHSLAPPWFDVGLAESAFTINTHLAEILFSKEFKVNLNQAKE